MDDLLEMDDGFVPGILALTAHYLYLYPQDKASLMDITEIKNHLQFAIPEELYDINPGQVVFFAPREGLSQRTTTRLREFFVYLRQLYKDNDVNLSIVPTDNELLIDSLAARNPNEVGIPYKVVVSTWDTIAGFASQFFDEAVEEIVERVPKATSISGFRISATDLPAIVEIDPENRPAKKQSVEQRIESSYQDGFDLGMKIARPERGSTAERKLIAKEEKKLEKILRECAVLGIDLDIDRIKKKVEEDLKNTKDYHLSIKTKSNPARPGELSVCDIYVTDSDDGLLDLTSIEKAVYLSFLLYKDGVRVLDAFDELRQVTRYIYLRLPGTEKTRKLEGGILDDENATYDAYMNTLRGYFTTIRDAVADKVSDPLIAQEFSIEGFKNSPYGIERSTKEIRKQIKEVFKLK